MMEFNSTEEAREYGKKKLPSDYYCVDKIKVKGQPYILVKDCKCYLDDVYGLVYEYSKRFNVDISVDNEPAWEIIEIIEKYFGYKFLDIYDEF